MVVLTSAVFSACVGKFSLAVQTGSQFGTKYDTDHSDCTNMLLKGKIK